MSRFIDPLKLALNGQQIRSISSNTAGITKIHRAVYTRMYPVTIVNSDGSSITVRHDIPRQIIKLPLDLSTLTDSERKKRLDNRKPRVKVKVVEDLDSSFDAKKYLKFIKK